MKKKTWTRLWINEAGAEVYVYRGSKLLEVLDLDEIMEKHLESLGYIFKDK